MSTRKPKPRNALMPTRRDIQFKLPAEKISTWNRDSEHLSHFMNTLSLFFPVGERFFIDAVRNYRDRITDPELKKAVTAFIGQEAMHGREHEEYNEAMFAAVPVSKDMERFVARLLARLQKDLPPSFRLSATIALEHFTAILADALLKDPRVLEQADPRFAALWRWHALEETEHKAVAYDVWATVMGKGPGQYLLRSGGLLAASVILWSIAIPFYLRVLHSEGKLTDVAGWRWFLRFSFVESRFFQKLARPWADYFRPGFHPWDHDNRHFLKDIDRVAAQLQAA
ncbi:MAG TPA: metal-dependent hydrolase [Solimonas sp.]|nr:metal-dependent hydrolase [Solimonas sp.]